MGAPRETYRLWLTASRLPDAELACGYLTDELVGKMLPEVPGEVVKETHATVVLFVTYVDGGDCGTIEMERTTRGRVLTDRSEECMA